MASRRHRSREHARRVRRPPAQEAARARGRAGDRHRARCRLPGPVKPLGIRRRLLLAVVAVVAVALAALLLGFNVLLQTTLDKSSKDLLRSRAAEQVSL